MRACISRFSTARPEMSTRPSLTQWIALAAAGGASFYGANRLAAPSAEEIAAEPIVRAEVPRTTSPAASADAAPVPTNAGAVAAAAGPPSRATIETGSGSETFRGMSWTPAPPPPPPAPPAVRLPPPPPSAPALPFRYVGMLEQTADKPTAFLAKGEALHVVRVGDVIDSTYRIESFSPAQVVVTYLPMDQRQTLSVAGGQP